MKLLIVEDDRQTSEYIVKGLSEEGHIIDAAYSGPDGLELASTRDYDVLVIDRMLPGLDGLSLVKDLRSNRIEARILFLTSLGTIGDRVDGLDAGGDDYLIKPFAFSELSARLNALARRPAATASNTVLKVGDLEMDLIRRRVTRGGEQIGLQPREFRLLEYMMRNSGRLLTRTMLLERVWEFHFDPKTNIVETHVSRLRSKLNTGFEGNVIQTVRGAGYMVDA